MKERNTFLRISVPLAFLLFACVVVLNLASCNISGQSIDINSFPNKTAESATISNNENYQSSLSDETINEYKLMLDNFVSNPKQDPSMLTFLKNRLTQLGVNVVNMGDYCSCYFDLPASEGYQDTPKLLLTGYVGKFSNSSDSGVGKLSYSYDQDAGVITSTGQTSLNGNGGLTMATAIALAKNTSIKHGQVRIFLYNNTVAYMRNTEIMKSLEGYDYVIDLGATNHVGAIATSFAESDSGALIYSLTKENVPSGYSSISITLNNLDSGNFSTMKADKHISSFEILQKISSTIENSNIDFKFEDISINDAMHLQGFDNYLTNLELKICVPSNLLEQCKSSLVSIEKSIKSDYHEPDFSITVSDINETQCFSQSVNDGIKNLLNTTKFGVTESNGKTTNILNIDSIYQYKNGLNIIVSTGYYGLYSDVYNSSNIDITNSNSFVNVTDSSSNNSYGIYRSYGTAYNAKYKIDNSNEFYTLVKNSITKTASINPVDVYDMEYSLLGQIYQINPAVSCVGLGFDVQNAGLTNEVVYTKSLSVYDSVLTKVFSELQNIDMSKNESVHQATKQAREAYKNYLSQNNVPSFKFKFINLVDGLEPALYCEGQSEAECCEILQYYNGEVKSQLFRRLGVGYIEGKGIVVNSDGLMDGYYDIIYKFENGNFSVVGNGEYSVSRTADTSNTTYKWDGSEVSSQEYQQKLDSLYNKYSLLNPLKNENYNNLILSRSDGYETFCKSDLMKFLSN